jgi:hypothetical protein
MHSSVRKRNRWFDVDVGINYVRMLVSKARNECHLGKDDAELSSSIPATLT